MAYFYIQSALFFVVMIGLIYGPVGFSFSTHEKNFIADLIIQQILAQFSFFFFFQCEFGKLKDDILEEDKKYFKQMFLILHESESKER